MRRMVILLTVLLAAIPLAFAGCSQEQGSGPTDELRDPEAAFELALDWLRLQYPDRAPEKGATWVTEDVPVLGPNGQPLLGAAEKRFTSDGWVADVSWAVVAPEFMQYQITLRSPTKGWFWKGAVKAMGGQVSEETGMQAMSEALAEQLAGEFLMASATFRTSGISGTLELVETRSGDCPYCWQFIFDFESRNSGYGDTTGQVVLPVITPHRAVITVETMDVVEAVMDGRWDMSAQKFIALSEEEALDIAGDFVRNSPTFVYDGIVGTLEHVETLYPDIENAWTFVFRFESAHAGYGDRTGQMLAQVITPHEAHVTVENGAVVSALMDEQWDMLQQKTV
jgi:hypothetical protein